MMMQKDRMNQTTRNNKGFSLSEMLVTILIMSLVAVLMTNGISLSGKAYKTVVEKANAQFLLSTTLAELRNNLSNKFS